jgi:hypothetical protein
VAVFISLNKMINSFMVSNEFFDRGYKRSDISPWLLRSNPRSYIRQQKEVT